MFCRRWRERYHLGQSLGSTIPTTNRWCKHRLFLRVGIYVYTVYISNTREMVNIQEIWYISTAFTKIIVNLKLQNDTE